MRPDRHLIQRQVIELRIDGLEGAELQNALARSYWERTVPELEQLFDRIAGPDECLRLDRLEVDLGLLAGRDWEPRFRSRLVEELLRALSNLRAERVARDAGLATGARAPVPVQQFLYFLVNGRLPWWGARPRRNWTDTVSPAMDAAGWAELVRVLHDDARARIRCVDSVTDSFLDDAIARWVQLQQAASVCVLLEPRPAQAGGRAAWRRRFWSVLLDWAASGGSRAAGGPALLRDLLALRRSCAAGGVVSEPASARQPAPRAPRDSSPHGESDLLPALEPGPLPEVEWHALPEPWREWATAAQQPPPGSVSRPPSLPASLPAETEQPSDSAQRAGAQRSDAQRSAAQDTAPHAEADPIYLSGAGAILLHPFLETLFRERKLLTGRRFTDVRARDRAIHLIGLLSFGECAAEYDLLLAKLLCGCPFEEPIEPVDPDDEDRAACDALLQAALRHWSVLRSNSPQWLRDQFLLRDGKLEPVDSGWRLTVERRAQDVLLARLPWGFGVVSPPWLQEKIFVQWLD